ncbi:MAG: adenylate/guanylate cyclase domain-containing protein, partial [Micromonosporaceae bacterium]
HDVLDSALVGPRVLLGCARLGQGRHDAALEVLGEVAAKPGPAVLFSARLAIAEYACALLAAGEPAEAVAAAQHAVAQPAEDVRGRVVAGRVLARALAAAGLVDQARAAAATAARDAHGTQQTSERRATDAVLAALG